MRHFKIVTKSQEKLKKRFSTGSNLESELRNDQIDIPGAIYRQDRRVKFQRLFSELNDAFLKLVRKTEEFFNLAGKIEKPDSIYPIQEPGLDDVTKNKDEFLQVATSFIDCP